MEQLLQQIAQGDQNIELALQALIKQQMDSGVSMEAALQAMIKQAQDQNLEPVLQALIKIQMENNAKQEASNAEMVKAVAKLGDALDPIKRFSELVFEGVKPKKGIEYYTPEEAEEFKKASKPVKGEDYFTEEDIASILTRATPLVGKDYFTDEEKEQLKAEITPVLGVDYFNGKDGYTPKKDVDFFDGEKGDKGDAFRFEDLTAAQKAELKGKDGSPDTAQAIAKKLAAYKKKGWLDIDAIKGWQAVVASLENQIKNVASSSQGNGVSGWGMNDSFLEIGDVPHTYVGSEGYYVRVKANGQGLEFASISGGAVAFLDLSDVPSAYTSQALKALRVNAGETALEFYTPTDANDAAIWGNITGTLANQTDLQSALDTKQATLVSATNIKTINSTSLLGAGDIAVATTAQGASADTAFGWGNHASAGYQAGDALLTSISGLAFAGNSLKILRVNAGETDFELVAAGVGGATELGELTDVGSATPTNRNVLVADGDSWESRALTEADISDLGTYLTAAAIGVSIQAYDAQLDTWSGITPSANGASLVAAADYAAMRTLLDLEAGTDFYSVSGANAAFQPLDADLTTIAGLTATTDNFIVSVASAWASRTPAQVRTTLGLVIGTNVQAYDADLTTWAGLTPSANAQSLITAANYAAMRTLLDLEAGTDFYSISAADTAFQPKDADLTALAGLTSAANKIPYFTGSGTAGLLDFKDEDDMTSNSATALPSQQSVKAYVDANAGSSSHLVQEVLVAPTTNVAVADGVGDYRYIVPSELNGYVLSNAHAAVITAGSSIGVITGDTVYVLDLESGSSQYAGVNGTFSISQGGDHTFEAWIKLESQPGTNAGYGIATMAWQDYGVQFQYRDSAGTKQLGITVHTWGITTASSYYNVALNSAQWYHVAYTWTGGNVEYFINGVSVHTGSPGGGGNGNDNTARFTVGAIDANGSRGSYFDGKIGVVRVFNDVRTDPEVAADMAVYNSAEAGLAAEYLLANNYDDDVASADLTASGSPTFVIETPGDAITTMAIQIHNVSDAVDMLSTKITLDSGEKTSYTAAAAPVINTANDDVATGDELRIDVDVIQSVPAKGLVIMLTFEPA